MNNILQDEAIKQDQATLGHYRILRKLGEGLTSKVWLAIDTRTNQKVAVKVFKDNLGDSAHMLIMTEVQAMELLDHKNVLKKLEYGTDNMRKGNRIKSVNYMALEIASGGEFFDYICSTGNLDEEYTRYYAKQLLEAVAYIHSKNVCHRDLKLENILLDMDFNLKVSDFGFAAPIKKNGCDKMLKDICGTKEYMPAEILEGKPYKGAPADLFYVGVILFTMRS